MKPPPPDPCPRCGEPVPLDAASPVCPACLLRAGLQPSQDASLADSETAHDPGSDIAVESAPAPGDSRLHGETIEYFGDYEVLERIAQGGMGVVYKARQKSLNRVVAVKMIRSGALASEMEVQRFLTEAEAAANLQHPNIVAIHEVGIHRGQHYFSMDYVEGLNLADAARQHPIPPQDAARLLLHVAEAIQYAHQRGILHRDLKPQNVLMDGKGEPQVTDFGLAKRIESDSQLTATGAVVGTPSYMAPEQASPRGLDFGPPGDVYALGAILYFLLTGQPPFTGRTALETMIRVTEDPPVPPRKLKPAVPPDLETICLKCLEKSPDHRYPTARALAEDLTRFLDHEPILARPAGRVRRGWAWIQKHPWLVAAGAFSAILALSLLSYGLWVHAQVQTWITEHPGDLAIWEFRPLVILSGISFLALSAGIGSLTIRFSRAYRRHRESGIPLPRSLVPTCILAGCLGAISVVIGIAKSIELLLWSTAGMSLLGPVSGLGGVFGFFLLIVMLQSLNLVWRALAAHDLSRFDEILVRSLQNEAVLAQVAMETGKLRHQGRRWGWIRDAASVIAIIILLILAAGVGGYWSDRSTEALDQTGHGGAAPLVLALALLNGACSAGLIILGTADASWRQLARRLGITLAVNALLVAVSHLLLGWSLGGRTCAIFGLVATGFALCIQLLRFMLQKEERIRKSAIANLPEIARDRLRGGVLNLFTAQSGEIHQTRNARWAGMFLISAFTIGAIIAVGCTLLRAQAFYGFLDAERLAKHLAPRTPGPAWTVPDSVNFAATPGIRALLDPELTDTNLLIEILRLSDFRNLSPWSRVGGAPRDLDLAAINTGSNSLPTVSSLVRADRARDLLQHLRPLDAPLDEVRKATGRPLALPPRIRLRYGVPSETNHRQRRSLETLSGILLAQASAHLALRHPEFAWSNLMVLQRTADALKDDRRVDSLRLRTLVIADLLQSFWEGWNRRAWSPDQMTSMGRWLHALDLLSELDDSIRIEEPWWADRRLEIASRMGQLYCMGFVISRDTLAFPPEFFGLRLLDYQLSLGFADHAFNPATHRIHPSLARAWLDRIETALDARHKHSMGGAIYRSFLTLSPTAPETVPKDGLVEAAFPKMRTLLINIARTQTLADQARLAIAIERYRTDHANALPTTLDTLVPTFIDRIPTDLFNGRPMPFRPLADGHYLLYSIGWNQTDDGGIPGALPRPLDSGDWTWSLPSD